ncbi:MAG TPA: NADPH:quinone reductase [Pirellulales bacterium]|jgi:NADPH2:quinone reductase|nr:NADPH:quinone reductase [Pirellulales bacterium]
MKAAYINQVGTPDQIIFGDLAAPEPTGSQVLVRVKAVAVNPIDTYIRAGLVKFPLPMPYIVGCDLAGVVERCAPNARRFQPGTRVWGSNQGLMGRQGTFSQFAAVDEDRLYPTPEGVSDQAAAALALVGITSHLGLIRCARLAAGETLFVNGGTGGIGSTVVQMAKALGAKVITTAGTAHKVALCRALGADRAVNYKTDDVDSAVREFAPAGVNVWWETVREPNFERVAPLLAMRGRMVLMAGRDARPVFPVGPFYVKDCSLHGFAIFNASPDEQRAAADDINRWLASGQLKPRIDRVLPLAKAAEAHRLQEENTLHKAGTLAGKIVLVV